VEEVSVAGIRSVLWVGRGERFAAELVADAPHLDVVWERDAAEAARLPMEGFHAVVLDAEDAGTAREGLLALGAPNGAPVLVRLAGGEAPAMAELRAAGAADVLVQRGDAGGPAALELLERIDTLARRRRRPPRRRPPAAQSEIVGASPQMQEVFSLVEVAGHSRATVLLSGETGTGKELVARAVHRGSPRSGGPFVAVNCAAFPDTLLESELFGHTRGSFTGADRDRRGLFEEAHGGVLFLDEVGETSRPFQAKLLRALQEREVRPVGGSRTRSVDVRVIAASNRDLRAEAAATTFREDLYYRLAVFPIRLPPLRERPGDVVPLAEHFLALHGRQEGKPEVHLSAAAERLLQSHLWPGNVRELENEIQRALALAEPGEALTPEHFSERVAGLLEPVEANLRAGDTLRDTLGRVEAWIIRRALEDQGGRRAATARRLGVTREGLYKKMKRHGIE
jgi:DNA-binding NtrC family response regulator